MKTEREQGEMHLEEINELLVVTSELREEIRAVREAHEFEGGPTHGLLGGSLAAQLDTDEKGERLEVRHGVGRLLRRERCERCTGRRRPFTIWHVTSVVIFAHLC